jgi:hypothetical protein
VLVIAILLVIRKRVSRGADHVPKPSGKLLVLPVQRLRNYVILRRSVMCSDAKRRIPASGTMCSERPCGDVFVASLGQLSVIARWR